MTKKLISILVAAIMALSLIPAAGLAKARTEAALPASEEEATVVLNVPTDIWNDGSGYQMLLDADATAYGTIIPEPGVAGKYTGSSYDDFEYMIPENADCSSSASNIVILGRMQINIPAGTYDYMITNPDNAGSIWIASAFGNVSGREDDFVFEANKTYTFTISNHETYDRVDLEVTDGIADPSVITTIAITGFVEPVWGEAPSYDVGVPATANYTIAYCDWNARYGEDEHYTLEEGDLFNNPDYDYYMFFVIEPNEGYTFAPDAAVTLNGSAELINFSVIDDTGIDATVVTVYFNVAEPIDLDLALNVEGGSIHFETEGEYPWIGVEDEDGRLYAKSGNAGVGSSESVLTATVNVEEGATVSFEFKAWGEGASTYWDYCEFAIDGERAGYWGAYQNEEWELFTSEPLTAGEHVLTWKYYKDGTVNKPGDCFMIDNVQVPEAEVEPSEVIGDVNNNGTVETADALMALRYAMGLIELTDAELARAEVDGDGEATVVDALLIIRYAMGLINSFPVED